MKKIAIIESLRAIAAISVCMFHFVCTTIGLFQKNAIIDAFNFGRYGVQVFFVISGFIIPYSMFYGNYKIASFFKFIIKRFIRLEPPYLISVLLVVIVIYLKHFFHFGVDEYDQLSVNRILLHLGYLINFTTNYRWLNQVYWTLAVEFQFYFFIAITYFLFKNEVLFKRIIGYVICVALQLLPISDSHYPTYSLLFLIGIVSFSYKLSIIKSLEFWVVFVSCVGYLIIFNDYVFAIVGGITSILIVFCAEMKLFIFDKLGKISYSIYLIHPIIGGSIINTGSRHVTTIPQKIGLVIIGFIITLISSFIMYYFIEKPSKKLSSQLKL